MLPGVPFPRPLVLLAIFGGLGGDSHERLKIRLGVSYAGIQQLKTLYPSSAQKHWAGASAGRLKKKKQLELFPNLIS